MSDVARILESYGAAQAEAARQRGQIWGQAIQSIGQIPQQVQQGQFLKAREQRLTEEAQAQQQLTGLKLQDAQRQTQGRAALAQAISANTAIDPDTGHLQVDQDKVYQAVSGQYPDVAQTFLQQWSTHNDLIAKTQEDNLKAQQGTLKLQAQLVKPVLDLPEEQRGAAYATMMGTSDALFKNHPELSATFRKLPPTYSPDVTPALSQLYESSRTQAERVEEALKKSTEFKNRMEGLKAASEATGGGPPSEAKLDAAYQAAIAARAQGQPLTAEQTAMISAYEKRKTLVPVANVNLNAPVKQEARTDRSYQQNAAALTAIEKPVADRAERIGRLTDTLNQGTTQAYALLAPELLTVMAGGQGSGLRMNEAEIARIVGGKSKWEQLRGALQQWSTDPTKASAITPEQVRQIRGLVTAVQGKVTAKQAALQKARQGLVDAEDVGTHRQIMADLDKQLNDIDAGGAVGLAGPPKLGEVVTVKGIKLRVTKINPDGSYEGVGVK